MEEKGKGFLVVVMIMMIPPPYDIPS